MRNAFADEITRLGGEHPGLVLLSGDIGNKLFDKFKEKSPDRFYNCGVAEANMMGVAAGLAMSGFHPVVYTITPFTTTRVMEQIRVDVCYQNAPVTIVGTGSGLSYASLGPTHHSCEDMAMLRSIPGMSVLAPGDPLEVRACLRAALAQDGPVYIRIGKKGEPVIHKSQPSLRIGQSIVVREGGDACLLAVGVMLPVALEVAKELEGRGIQARVVSVISVKPFDVGLLHEVFATHPVVATIEEHGLIGGFGAGVAEWLVDNKLPSTALLRFGTKDKFIHESGELEFAREVMGIDPHSITAALVERVERDQAFPHLAGS